MKKLLVPIFLLVFVSFAFALGGSHDKGQETIIVSGRLIKIAAIGGETTGWAIDLESPLEIDGKQSVRIEVDPGNKDIARFEDRQVEVTGTLEKRRGIERGVYPVIVIEKISE
jgi:hypothetical protein